MCITQLEGNVKLEDFLKLKSKTVVCIYVYVMYL